MTRIRVRCRTFLPVPKSGPEGELFEIVGRINGRQIVDQFAMPAPQPSRPRGGDCRRPVVGWVVRHLVQWVGEMRKAHPGPPIGIVSALATPENVMAAIDAGAAAFIPKTMGAKAMLVALRLVLAGERYVPAGFLKTAHEAGARSTERQFQPMLSGPEAGVLKLLKDGKSNKEIGRALGLEEYTVKYHVRGIFRKLGAKNRSQAMKIAMERDLPGTEGSR